MKKLLLLFLWEYCCIDVFCQTPIFYETPQRFQKLTIAENTEIVNNTTLTIDDTLFVFGKLTNNGVIQAKTCIVDGGTLICSGTNSLTITDTLFLKNTTISSLDTQKAFSIATGTCVIDDYTEFQSGSLNTNDLVINDTLVFSTKLLGVKKVFGDFIINPQGCFLNTVNDNIQLHGNAINNSAETCTNANFEVFGINKHIYGNFSCYRFDFHDEQSSYTNHNWLEVKEVFSGNGTLTQAQNSYLSIHTNTTPRIIADSVGNTLEYTRGGKNCQYLNTSHCYNLVLSKDNSSRLALTQDCILENTLTLNKKSFLDCNSHSLIFNHANKNSIIAENFNEERGIFLNHGTIDLSLPKDETITIPLFTLDTIFAGIALKNLDENHNKITIDSLWNFVSKTGKSNEEHFETDFINTTWHVTSAIEKATMSFFWNAKKELPEFNPENCLIFLSDGTHWEPSTEKNTRVNDKVLEITTNPNSFFTIGNYPKFLGITFDYFTLVLQKQCAHLSWKTDNKTTPCYIERACSSLGFTTIATLYNSDGMYDFADSISSTGEMLYYRIKQYDTNGDENYSEIQSVIQPQETNIYLDHISGTISTTSEKDYVMRIYNENGSKLQETINGHLQVHSLPHDCYIVQVKTNRGTFQQKIIW